MKWFVALAAGLTVLGALFFLTRSPEIPKVTRDGPIVAFGDSLIYGTGSSGGGFVKMLEEKIQKPIVNLGIPGETTGDGLKRLESVIGLKPSVVILLLGGNDYLRRIPQGETFANLETIIQRLQEDGVSVFLIGVRGGVLRDNFASRYEELAEKFKVAYVHDVLDDTLGVPKYMDDQVHPNDAGYRVIAERVYPVLAEMIER